MPDSFVHLHTHTEYSLLDGAARIKEIVAVAVEDGQPALGITDHGNMYGVLDFYRACKAQGITPIIGTEAYMALESRHERPSRKGNKLDDSGGDSADGKKLYYHLTLLAANDTGYRNLLKLSSAAFLEGYYYKPRMDWEMFEQHSEGLIATTGCLGSVVQQALLADDYDEALRRAGRLQDIFGRDSMYVEMQDHGIGEQHRCNPQLLRIAQDLGAPLLATNDLHYTRQADAVSHDALLCVQTGAVRSDPNRFKFHGDQHYLKSAAEMRALFAEIPQSCDNTLAIAERANVNIEFGQSLLPQFDVPAPHDDDAYLLHLAMEGATQRWGEPLPQHVAERLAYELKVISDMGFSSYFLITWDLIRHAREVGIRVGPGRGSAAGCVVAYCLRITDLDPIRYDLLFERFLNPARVSMPDIDIDFDDRYRDEMIRYTAQRYGRDHVAQIITFSTIKARAAIRDSARVLDKPYAVGDRIAKSVPPLIMGRDTPLRACLAEEEAYKDGYAAAAKLRGIHATDSEAHEVMEVALGLEGLIRQDSIHAAAVVISPEPLTNYLPIQCKPKKDDDPGEAPIVTQYDMGGVESLGLLKMDFLGLRTLSIIDEAIRLITRSTGAELDIDRIPLDDMATFDLLRAGDTMGIFQLESDEVRKLLREIAPTQFEDICALVALYRPGPMAADMHNGYARRKNGAEPPTPPHSDLTELLGETYGLMIYQESMMRVAQKIAGYSMAEADDLRKACGKKNREQIAEHRTKFVEGSAANGYTTELGAELFDIIEPFADYAFNKSHAFAYGLIAYQTAYLKANHPTEFLAAVLTGSKRNIGKAGVYLADCRRHDIEVLVPDINRSEIDFAANGREIPFGLSAVRNVGEKAAEPLLDERETNGPFVDFRDFCERVPRDVLNKRLAESLIKAGAFENCGHSRAGLLEVYERIIEGALRRRDEQASGLQSMFGSDSDEAAFDETIPIPRDEADDSTIMGWEKELLGLYVSRHPLRGLEQHLRTATSCSIADLREFGRRNTDGQVMTVGGMIQDLQTRYTRNNDLMAKFVLDDIESAVQVTVFPKTMVSVGSLLKNDVVVLVTGRPKEHTDDDTEEFFAETVRLFRTDGHDRNYDHEVESEGDTNNSGTEQDDPSQTTPADPLVLDAAGLDIDGAWLQRLDKALSANPGGTPIHLRLSEGMIDLSRVADRKSLDRWMQTERAQRSATTAA